MNVAFVATTEDIRKTMELLKAPKYAYEVVSVEFDTTTSFIEEVLPPSLEPTEKPTAMASISRWQGLGGGAFDCASVAVAARYRGLEGWWSLALIVNTDMAVAWGREMWGECKKYGPVEYRRDDQWFYGSAERHGVKLIEIEALFDAEEKPAEDVAYAFEVKATPRPDGQGLDEPAQLVTLQSRSSVQVARSGRAQLNLRGNGFDELDSIPIASVGHCVFSAGTSDYQAIRADTIDAQAHLPYVFARQFDDRANVLVPLRFRD